MKYKVLFLLTLAIVATVNLKAQLNIGSTAAADPSAILQATSTTKGFLPPLLTTAQRNAIVAPATGLIIFNTTTNQQEINTGTTSTPVWGVNAAITLYNGDGALATNRVVTQGTRTLSFLGTGGMLLKSGTVNFDSSALIGKGDSIGNVAGIGITAQGGLNMGQSTGNNILIGYRSGRVTTGTQNHVIGYQAGYNNTTGNQNHFEGYQAGNANTTGNFNHFAGYQAGFNNTTANLNYFSGYQSGFSNTTGTSNTFIGFTSGYSNTTGNSNTFNGIQSGHGNTTGSSNNFTGYQSGYSNTTGSGNQFDGQATGFNTTIATNNLFVGNRSGYSNVTGSSNLFVGYQSGYNDTASINQFIGYQSGYNNIGGTINQFDGYQSGTNNTTGTGNLFIGYQSGLANTTTSNNQFIGYQSGLQNTTGANNTFTGVQTGYTNNTGVQNVFTGFQSGLANTTGNHNTFTGYRTGYANINGGENVFTGYTAGLNNTSGSNNTFEGWQSGLSNSTGVSNSFIGYNSGISNTTGINNSFLGFSAGNNNTTGNNNASLGYGAGPATSGLTNTTAIGYNTQTTVSNTVILGNGVSVGIGVTAPAARLQVVSADNAIATNILDVHANNQISGIGIGWGGIRSTSTNTNDFINIDGKGTGAVSINANGGTGNVGIGTTAPSEKLEVDGSLRLGGEPATAFVGWGSYIEFDGNGESTDEIGLARYNVTVGSTNQTELRMVIGDDNQNSGGAHADRFVIGAGGGGLGSITTATFTPGFFVYSQGQTGIGGVTPNASYMLDVNGNIHTNASVIAGGTTLTSDRRLKKNITGLHSALANVMKLAPVSYEKKSSISASDYSFKEMGFVAQDLQKVFPQLVHEGSDADKTLSVDYNSLIPVLTKAIQEQQAQNDTQVADIARLIQSNIAITTQNDTQLIINKEQAIEIALLKKENLVIAAQLSDITALKLAVAQLTSQLNKTTVTQAVLPIPVTVNN